MATKHTREDRYKAAAALVATGNSKATSRESGIPASTIRHWSHNDDDFQLMCQEIKTEFGEKIKYKFAEIINESADQTLDRLQNGDVIRDSKTGEMVRVPIKGKEAAIIGAVAFDKLRGDYPLRICAPINYGSNICPWTFLNFWGPWLSGGKATWLSLLWPYGSITGAPTE